MTRRAAPGSRVAGRWTLPFLPFASFLAACSDRASLEVPADTPVVLVVIDTLRADRLGCYGCPLETSPVLDAFAERAFVFEANSTQLNSTFGSLTSIFTGLYPKSHQMFLPVPTEAALASAPDGVSLTERLASRGDHRLGVVSHPSFAETDPRAIVMRGWDAFSVIDPTRPIRERIFCAHGGDTNARLLPRLDEAIEAAGDGPLFVFAHYFDPHTERFDLVYDAPEETRNLFLRHHLAEVGREEVHDELAALPPMERPEWIREHAEGTNDLRLANGRALYDAEIRSCDRHVGTFFDRLRERGLFDRALIVVMADHGENLGHVGRPPRAAAFTHQRLFEGVVHTPLMIKLPHQREGARIPAITQNVDVLPTLVELLGLPEAPPADGKSLVPLLAGEARAVHDLVFMESSDGLERAVRTDAFKLIDPGDGRSPMLFRWRDDPMERNDVRDEVDPENLRRLADALETFTPTTGTFVRLERAVGPYRASVEATLSRSTWRDVAGGGVVVDGGVARWEGTVAERPVEFALFHTRASAAVRFRIEREAPGRIDRAVTLGDTPLARTPLVPTWTVAGAAPTRPWLRLVERPGRLRVEAGRDLPVGAVVRLSGRVASYEPPLAVEERSGFEVEAESVRGVRLVVAERGASATLTRETDAAIDLAAEVDGVWIDPGRIRWGDEGIVTTEIAFEIPRLPSPELTSSLTGASGAAAPPGSIRISRAAGELVTEIDREALDPELARQLEELGYLK